MKIAIHHSKGSFSEGWISYCDNNNISYKIVNAYSTNIINDVKDCDVFMWHYHHMSFKDNLTAKRILFAMEHSGITVFPNFKTGWHFDDKVAQKYLLESIKAPLVPSYVFYEKNESLEWAENTSYPKVFKLKGGAGASNVRLVNSCDEAKKIIAKAFKTGFPQFDKVSNFKEKVRLYREGKSAFLNVLKSIAIILTPYRSSQRLCNEKGYVYFQDFIPNNSFDIRVIIVQDRAFGIKRLVRKNDFRASGSGNIIYDKEEIDVECVSTAFEVNNKIKAQSIAFDFVFDKNNKPLIVEISYGFIGDAYNDCDGYWTKDLAWHKGKVSPYKWLIDSFEE